MIVYGTACICTVLFSLFGSKIEHKRDSNFYYFVLAMFSSLPLNIVASIRYNVGQDYPSYQHFFEMIQRGKRPEELEWLYYWLNKVVAELGGSYLWITVLTSSTFLIIVFMHIFYDSPMPVYSVFLLFSMSYYFVFMNGIRQLIGCAIAMYALRFIEQKKWIWFVLFVVIASGFHVTCILFLIAYFLYHIRISPKLIIGVTIIVAIFSKYIAIVLNSIISASKYSRYIGSKFDTGKQGYIVLAINVFILVFATLYYRRPVVVNENNDEEISWIELERKKYQLYYNLQVISVWLATLTGKVVLINRIRWLFGLPSIILIPMVLKHIENRATRFIIASMIVMLYIVYIYYTVGINNSNTVLPYKTIFSIS